jgi:hypothetical protein
VDKTKVINEGPWMVFDHHLAVSHWSTNFVSSSASWNRSMVWICICWNIATYVAPLSKKMAAMWESKRATGVAFAAPRNYQRRRLQLWVVGGSQQPLSNVKV